MKEGKEVEEEGEERKKEDGEEEEKKEGEEEEEEKRRGEGEGILLGGFSFVDFTDCSNLLYISVWEKCSLKC